MTREEIRLSVAISVIQGVLEAKHGVIGEVVPSVAVAIALRIADAFVEEWYRETKEQKPEEWDKLQEEFRNINEAFEDGKKEVVAHPKKYGLCKPAEWSEEDETIIEGACNALEVYGHIKLVNKLKSLRPSWKPSEKQMKALKDVIETVPMTCRQQVPLESLYADLQKL